MTDRVLLSLGYPSPKLNPNRCKGRHWSWNNKERKAAVIEGHGEALLRGAKNLQGERFTLRVTAYPPTAHARDDDNLIASLKHHRDGIAKAMGVDDKLFQWEFAGFEKAPRPGVLIEIVSGWPESETPGD